MGIRLRYLEWEGAGTPVLLLHGLTVCAEYWSMVARLLAFGHRVVAVDLRGHGHSDKPDWGYDYPTLAADVNQLAEETAITHAMVAGHSWGAGVALALAATHPRRVSFLAMVDGGFGGRRRADPPADGVEPDYSRMMAPPEIYRSRQTYLAAAGAGLGEVAGSELEEILMASVTVNDDGSISERLTRDNHVRILQSMGNLDAPALYQRVKAPVLFAGSLSPVSSSQEWNDRKREAVARVRRLVAVSEERWFRDSAHDIQLHHPKELAEVMEGFMQRKG